MQQYCLAVPANAQFLYHLPSVFKSTFGGRVNRRKPSCRGRTWVSPRPLEQRFVPHSPELPAVKKEDFSLEVPDGYLTLSGERKFEERSRASNIIA
jgi:hypothetical protein